MTPFEYLGYCVLLFVVGISLMKIAEEDTVLCAILRWLGIILVVLVIIRVLGRLMGYEMR